MSIKLKSTENSVQNFINANLHADLHGLLLKKSPFPEVTMQELVQQIKGRKVAEKKFPFLLKEGIIFPPHLSLEQASSQNTAAYKAQFFQGKSFVDFTCGFGIDAYFLGQKFQNITLVEQNSELLELVKHNWQILGKEALFLNQDLEDFLKENKDRFDLIYLDPARRDQNKRKVFLLEDLSPNILEIQEKLFNISDKILIKLSPLIDLSHLIDNLEHVEKIWIVSVKNEVKEILVLLEKSFVKDDTEIICVNLESEENDFTFKFKEEKSAVPEFSEPEKFIYLPNNSVLKSGAFNLISSKFNLKKLHSNTHIYTSLERVEQFPGRVFEMEKIEGKSLTKGEKYNVISKNHPLSPEEIKRKYKVKDGGNRYLIFTQSFQGKLILKSL
ncbi:MAG: RsmD family RNA methyltransferase [Cloacibacterium sp.]|nr:RsmD family RNA methyltransferase [Cloacibacterium sp.]